MPAPIIRIVFASFLTLIATAGAIPAQSLAWDPTHNPSSPAGGDGTWTADAITAPFNWSNGTADVPWNSGVAVFGGTGGTVTIDATGVSATGLSFTATAYSIGGGSLTLTGPGIVTVAPPVSGTVLGQSVLTATINSAIGGSVGLTKAGSGTLVLTGANSFTGAVTLSGGNLTLDFNAAGAAATILGGNNSLVFGGVNTPGATFAVNGNAAGSTQAVNGVSLNSGLSVIAATSNTGGMNLNLGAITRSNGSALRFNLPAAGAISTTTPNANPAGGQQTILGGYAVVGGTTPTWAVSGTGATAGAITGLATYAPVNTVVAGQDIDVTVATSTAAAVTINSLRLTPGATAYMFTLGGALTIATGGVLLTPGATNTTIGPATSTLSSGTGELVFNNYSTSNGGAARELFIAAQLTGNTNVTINGVPNGLFSTQTNAGGQVELQNPNNNFTGTITVIGARLGNGANNQANLSLGNATNPIIVVGTATGGGQWFMNNGQNQSRPITLSGFGWTETAGGVTASFGAFRARSTISGPITLAGNARIGSGNGATLSGVISGPYELSLDGGTQGSTTPQTITISGTTNSWSGGTRLERGNLNMGALNALPTATTVTFGTTYGTADNLKPVGLAPPILNLNGFATTVGALAIEAGDTTAAGATVTNTGAAATFTVNATTSSTFAGVVAGAVALTKSGPATLTLTNTNTYTGATLVSGGTLVLTATAGTSNIASSSGITVSNGTLNVAGINGGTFALAGTQTLTNNGAVTGAVTVPANTTITGNGTFGGAVTITGGTLTPGTTTTVGSIASIGNLAVNSGTFKIKVNGAVADQITTITGSASFASNSVLSVAQFGAPTSPSFTILTSTGPLTGLTAGPLTTLGRTTYSIDATALAANSLKLNITGGPANMRWVGGGVTNPTRWENTQLDANWTTADPVVDNTHFFDGDFVTFNNNNNGNFTVNVSGTVSPGAVAVANTGGTTYTFADGGAGVIAGNTGLAMTSDGTGILVIGTHNTFAGPVSITNGIVSISSADNLGNGSASNTLTLAGGTLRATATVDLGATRPVALGAGGGTVDVPASATLTVSGPVSGAGAGNALTKTGAGTLVLSGTNTYAGPTTISAGTLRVTNSASLGALPGGAVTVPAGAILDLGGGGVANALNFGQKVFVIAGDGDGTTGAITNSVAINQQNALQRVQLSADASVGGANRFDIRANQVGGVNVGQLDLQGHTFTKNGTFPMSIVSVDISDGNIVVNGGTFAFEASTNCFAGAGTTVTYNANTIWQFFGYTGTLSRPIIINGTGITVGTNNNTVAVAASPVTLNGDLTATTINANGTGTVTLNGAIGETGGPRSITKTNNGTGVSTLVLGGNNTFSGGVNFNSGIVEISTVNNLGTGPLTFNGGTLRFATGSGGADVSVRTTNFAATATIDTNGNSATFANPIGNGGGGSLSKIGAGTLTLAAGNTYTGQTSVTAGTLLVANATGSGTGAGAVLVTGSGAAGSGGTLGGGNAAGTTGFIAGSVTISSTVAAAQGGTIAPGMSVGTLTVTGGTMTWDPVGAYRFEHDASATSPAPIGGTSDLLRGTGAAVLDLQALGTGAGQQFNLVLVPTNFPAVLPTSPVAYTIADYSASSAANPQVLTPGAVTDLTAFFNITGGFQGTPTVALVNGNLVQVTFTPVPEAAFVMLACGAVAVGCVWWNRQRADRKQAQPAAAHQSLVSQQSDLQDGRRHRHCVARGVGPADQLRPAIVVPGPSSARGRWPASTSPPVRTTQPRSKTSPFWTRSPRSRSSTPCRTWRLTGRS
jgi:fibronectin-binding autotransporter adhesin